MKFMDLLLHGFYSGYESTNMNCLRTSQQILYTSKTFYNSLYVLCQYFHDKKNNRNKK